MGCDDPQIREKLKFTKVLEGNILEDEVASD
jgi:hypothetical protein